MTQQIGSGTAVEVRDARGNIHTWTAAGCVEDRGDQFSVIPVNRPLFGGGTDICPWPASAVSVISCTD